MLIEKINVTDLVKSNDLASIQSGYPLFEKLFQKIDKDEKIIVSFSGVTMLTTAFVANTIGSLYGSVDGMRIPAKKIEELLIFEDLNENLTKVLVQGIESAKRHYSNPIGYGQG